MERPFSVTMLNNENYKTKMPDITKFPSVVINRVARVLELN